MSAPIQSSDSLIIGIAACYSDAVIGALRTTFIFSTGLRQISNIMRMNRRAKCTCLRLLGTQLIQGRVY